MRTIFIAILTIVIIGCISPFDFDGVGETRFLIVEGGVYEKDSTFIDLKFSDTKFVGGFARSIVDASVRILENNEIEHTLKYDAKTNLYLMMDKNFRGKPRNSYQLIIKLADGKEYISTKDTLFGIEQPFSINNQVYDNDSKIDIIAKIGARKITPEFFMFRFINYKKPTYCAECPSRAWYDLSIPNDCGSDFKNCNSTPTGSTRLDSYGFNCIYPNKCWNFKKLKEIVLFSDEILQNQTEREVRLINIPISSYARYFVESHQYKISKMAYNYFKSLNDIEKKTGTLFDPIPTFLAGNISMKADPKNKSLGYFLVAGQKIKGHFVDRSILKTPLIDINPEKEYKESVISLAPVLFQYGCRSPPLSDCRVSTVRTDKIPVGWINY